MNPTAHLYEIIWTLSTLCGVLVFVLIVCGVLMVKSKSERNKLQLWLGTSRTVGLAFEAENAKLKKENQDLHLRSRQFGTLDELKAEIEELKKHNAELYKTLASKD